MAENKKSFLLYCDLIHTVRKMPLEKAGELFNHILEYVNDNNPVNEDLLIQLTFEPIKQQLKRDLAKYEDKKTKNSANARKRWDATAYVGTNRNANDADNDNVIDNVNDNDTVTDNVILLNKKGFFLNSLSKNLALSEDDVGKTIIYIKLKTKIEINEKFVIDFWEAFKIENFDKKEWKNSFDDVISHFRNSLKIQVEKNGTNRKTFTNNGAFSKSDAKIAALNELR